VLYCLSTRHFAHLATGTALLPVLACSIVFLHDTSLIWRQFLQSIRLQPCARALVGTMIPLL
jgi:hypothetical protein